MSLAIYLLNHNKAETSNTSIGGKAVNQKSEPFSEIIQSYNNDNPAKRFPKAKVVTKIPWFFGLRDISKAPIPSAISVAPSKRSQLESTGSLPESSTKD
jgi:hypothetical protein